MYGCPARSMASDNNISIQTFENKILRNIKSKKQMTFQTKT